MASMDMVDEAPQPQELGWLVSLVEALDHESRTIVEGFVWERKTKVAIGLELGLSPSSVQRRWRRAMKRLRHYAEVYLMSQCSYVHEVYGRCQQHGQPFCSYHWGNKPASNDRYYNEKITRGLLQPVDTYLTPEQIDAMFNGAIKGDGRPIDQYVESDDE